MRTEHLSNTGEASFSRLLRSAFRAAAQRAFARVRPCGIRGTSRAGIEKAPRHPNAVIIRHEFIKKNCAQSKLPSLCRAKPAAAVLSPSGAD